MSRLRLFSRTVIFAAAVFAALSFLSPRVYAADYEPTVADLLAGRRLGPGDDAIAIVANTLDGKKVDLQDYFGKKAVVFAFWLNNCDLCAKEFKKLRVLAAEKGVAGKVAFFVVARGADKHERAESKIQLKEAGNTFKVLLDPDLMLAKLFTATKAPSFVLIDKQGRVVNMPVFHVDRPMRDLSFADYVRYTLQGTEIPAIQLSRPTAGEIPSLRIGKPAPAFEAPALGGGNIIFPPEGGGRAVVAFWHPSCKECVAALKELQRFTVDNAAKYGFRVYSCASLYGDKQVQEARQVTADNSIDISVAIDRDSVIGVEYGVQTIPTFYVVGADGVVVDVIGEKGASKLYETLDADFGSMK